MKNIKKLFILLIVVMMAVVTIIPTVKADEVEKDKTATGLDKDFDTTITLTLNPKKEETRIIDIVLVAEGNALSGSTGQDFIKEASVLINNLNARDNIQANIAIVVYGVDGAVIMDLTDSANITKDYLANKLTEQVSKINANKTYSNLQNGLRVTKDVLDNSNTGSNKADRYVILLSDGSHFTYNNGKQDPDTHVYQTASAIYKASSTTFYSMGNMDVNGDVGAANRDTKSTLYLVESNGDYGAAFDLLMAEYESVHAQALKGYDYFHKDATEINELAAQGNVALYSSSAQIDNLETYPYTSNEIGTVEAAHAAEEIKDEGYNIFTIGYLYEWGFDDDTSTYILKLLAIPSYGFVKWMGNLGPTYVEDTKSISAGRFDEIYGDLETEMFPKVEKDTYLIDEMGFGKYKDGSDYDFEFVNDVDKLTIKVGTRVLGAVKISDNVYGFGEDDSLSEGYQFILTYYKDGIDGITDNECIKIEVNEDIKGGEPIEIEYHEVLGVSSRKSDPGAYADLNVSNSTIMFLANGERETFDNPKVSYQVRKNPNTTDKILIYGAFLAMSLLLVLVLANVKKQQFNK